MKCRPGKWLMWTPIALLPLLAAFVIGTRGLTEDITQRAFQNITAAGGDWAAVTWNGRDASITGDAPSQDAIDKAIAAVADTYGVRRVTSSARVVAPPPKVELPLPTIEPLLTNNAQPEIRGTWPEGAAKTLAVTLGATKYVLGQNNELSSNAGAWVLKPSAPLADGDYDAAVEISDGATTTAAAAPGKITIDTKTPEMPSLLPAAPGAVWPFALTGKWAEGDAVELTAKLAGKTFAIGQGTDFSSDGKGNWTLAPAFDLAPGSYDLELESRDKAGNVAAAKLTGAIVVPEPTQPVAPAAPAALTPPTIDPLVTNLPTPKITGAWPEGLAKSLTVILNGAATTLGAPGLTSEGGKWTFTPQAPLADGSYDVSAEITDAAGNKIASASAAKVTVDTAPPSAPVVTGPPPNTPWPYAFTGTWPEGDATGLEAQFAGRGWIAGQDPQFTSDGKGNWRFDPALDLQPGSYDLAIVGRDAAGNQSRVDLPAAVVIAAAEPAPKPAEPPKAEEPPPVEPAEPPKAEEPPPQPAEQPKAEQPPSPPPASVAPTVQAVTATMTRPEISGTMSAGDTLKVTVAGTQYVQGTDENLKVDGQGNWSLAIATPLGDGAYEVLAEATDSTGKTLADSTSNELTIDAAGPASPAVTLQSVEGAISAIAGTWAEGDAQTLRVSIPAATVDAILGQSPALTSDGKGNWALALAEPLRPGSYDVAVETADAMGRVSRDQTRFELLVKEPYDCEAALAQLTSEAPVRFDFRRTRINPPYDAAVDAYAAFMKDPRCAGFSMTVEGHADVRGPESFNQQLSELRAMQVVDAMVTRGVDPSRLATVGMSENMPLEKGRSIEKRKMNRRVEFKLSK